jgi:hypothetical protein
MALSRLVDRGAREVARSGHSIEATSHTRKAVVRLERFCRSAGTETVPAVWPSIAFALTRGRSFGRMTLPTVGSEPRRCKDWNEKA